jgi:WD40 repeat protein
VWDVKDGMSVNASGGGGTPAYSCLLLPNGAAYVVTRGRHVEAWALVGEQRIITSPASAGTYYALDCSADSRLLATGDSEGVVQLLNPATLKAVRVLPRPHKGEVLALAFHPKGTRLVSAGSDKVLLLRDVRTGAIRRFSGHSGAVTSVAFSPDGRYILSGGKDRTVRLWDVALGREKKLFSGHKEEVRGVAFDPRGKRVVSCGEAIKVWPLPPDVVIKTGP